MRSDKKTLGKVCGIGRIAYFENTLKEEREGEMKQIDVPPSKINKKSKLKKG